MKKILQFRTEVLGVTLTNERQTIGAFAVRHLDGFRKRSRESETAIALDRSLMP
jgi:hypothetical protein